MFECKFICLQVQVCVLVRVHIYICVKAQVRVCVILPYRNQSSICFLFHHISTSINHIIALAVMTFIQTSYVLGFFNTCKG